MGIWAEIIGIRRGLDLRRKWWHQAAIAVATLSSLIVFLAVSTIFSRSRVTLTKANTHSLTLLHYTLGRPGTTTLDDLDGLTGLKVKFTSAGSLIMVKRAPAPETIRCGNPAPFDADSSFTRDGVTYRAIPDRAGQQGTERRHCAATPAYMTATADSVAVAVPDSSLVHIQGNKGFFAGMGATSAWLLLYWMIYYRAIIPIYLKRRDARRRRRRYAQYLVR